MTPEQVADSYDRIAERWLDVSTYGFAQIERAVAFVKRKRVAQDVGCGAGRCVDLLARHGLDGVGCVCRHLEYDQYPEAHVYLIAQKPESERPGARVGVGRRPLEPCDLPRMSEMQLDRESNRMAVTIPRSREAFFVIDRVCQSPASERYPACEEAVLVLR